MDVQPNDVTEVTKKGKQSGFASAFSFWKQHDDKALNTTPKGSHGSSTSTKTSSSTGRRSKNGSGTSNASESSASSHSERSGGLTISSSLEDSSTISSTAAHSNERENPAISTTSALRASSTRNNNASHAMTTTSEASESESSEHPSTSPSNSNFSATRRGNLAEEHSDSKLTRSLEEKSPIEGTIAVEPLIPHTSKYWSPSRSRQQSSTPRLADLPAHMIRSEPVIVVPPKLIDTNAKEISSNAASPSNDGLTREGSSDSVTSSKGSRSAQSAAPSVLAATMSPRKGESPLDRLILSSTSKLRLSNDSVPSTGSRSSLTQPPSNQAAKSNSASTPSSTTSSVPPRISEQDTKHASQVSIGAHSAASGTTTSSAYSGAGSDEPHLGEHPETAATGGVNQGTHPTDDAIYGLSSAGSRSTLSSNNSASPSEIYYRRAANGNTSSPGVILTATTATPSPPTPGGPTLSVPGNVRMLHQMGGSAGTLVNRSRDSRDSQRQSPTSPVQDLWSLSEQILLELSSNGSTTSRSPGSSPSNMGAASALTSARSNEAEDGSSQLSSPMGSLDAGSSMSTSSHASSTATANASSTKTTATTSREETDDSAEPSDLYYHSSPSSSTHTGSSAPSTASSSEKRSGDKNIKLSRRTTPPNAPQSARPRGTVSDLAGAASNADSVSSMQSAPAGMHHRRTRSKDKRDSKRRLDPALNTTPEEVEPLSPTSSAASSTASGKPNVIPLDMRFMSNPNSARSVSSTGLDSPSSSDSSAHFPRRDKVSTRSTATPSSPGGSRLRVHRQFSSEMLDAHTVSRTDAPEPHRLVPRTPSSSALSSSHTGGSSASTTSGSFAGNSSSDDLSSSSSDASGSPAMLPKKKNFFSSLFSSAKKRRTTIQLASSPLRDFSSADSPEMGSRHGSPHMSPVYSKKHGRERRNSSDFVYDVDDDLSNGVRPRGNSVAEVQHSRHMTSDLDDFTASPIRRDSVRSIRGGGGLTDLLSPRPGEQITYRSNKVTSMPSSPYESDEDGISQSKGTSSAKSTSEFIGYHGTRHGATSNESTPEKDVFDSPSLKRRNSLDPSSAKMAFRSRNTGNSTGDLSEDLTQSTLSPTSSSRGGPGGTLKDSKKKDKKSAHDALSASMSPPSPKRVTMIFGVPLEPMHGRLNHHHHHHSQSLGGQLASPTSPTISASPSTSSLAITPRTPDGLAPLSPRQDCPDILTAACHALLTMARDPADKVDFSDAFSTTATFSAKDKKTLRLALEDGSMDLATEKDAKMIAQAILTYLEDLPDALCTFRLFGDFLVLLQMDDEKLRLMAAHSLVWSLPRTHRATFILLIDFIVSMANTALLHDQDDDDEVDRRREYLLEFFAPAIFRARSYSSIHTSPRPYMLGELKGTNLSSAFSSAHGSNFTVAVHAHSTGGGNSSAHLRSPSSGNVSASRDPHFEGLTSPVTPLTAPSRTNTSVVTSSAPVGDGSTIGPFMVPRSPRSPPLHFGDPTPLSSSHATSVPQPTTFSHSSAASTGPLNPTSTRTRHGHSASVSGPSGPTTAKGAVLVPPLQLPTRTSGSGNGLQRSKSNDIYKSSDESTGKTKVDGKSVPVHISGTGHAHGSSSSKPHPMPRAQSTFSPATSPPNSPTAQSLSARSIFQAIALLRLVVEEHEIICSVTAPEWTYELAPGPAAICMIESGTIDFLFDLLGNPFYHETEFAQLFLLGIGELLSPQEVLDKIISRVRSGDSTKPWVRMRGTQLLRALSTWVHCVAHLLAPIRPFFADLEALVHSSIDEEETQTLTNVLAELTIVAGSQASPKNPASSSSSTTSSSTTGSKRKSAGQGVTSTVSETSTPAIDVSPVHQASGPITGTPAEILAQHLTMIDAEYLKALKTRCSLDDAIGGFLSSAPFVSMSDRFNTVSLWVQYEVVSGINSKERAARVVYFSNVAAALVSYNNFNGALAVFTGICSVNVTRMIKMMASARKRAGKVLDGLESLFSMTKNSKNYTDRLRASTLPAIPQIVLYARNLFSLGENNVAFEDSTLGKIMNVAKFREFVKHTNELAKYQSSTYYFARDPNIYHLLSNLHPPSDDHIYGLSLRAEAKKKDNR